MLGLFYFSFVVQAFAVSLAVTPWDTTGEIKVPGTVHACLF